LERHHSIFLYLGMGETYSSLKLFKWWLMTYGT
jgi:hypothetical protein